MIIEQIHIKPHLKSHTLTVLNTSPTLRVNPTLPTLCCTAMLPMEMWSNLIRKMSLHVYLEIDTDMVSVS